MPVAVKVVLSVTSMLPKPTLVIVNVQDWARAPPAASTDSSATVNQQTVILVDIICSSVLDGDGDGVAVGARRR